MGRDAWTKERGYATNTCSWYKGFQVKEQFNCWVLLYEGSKASRKQQNIAEYKDNIRSCVHCWVWEGLTYRLISLKHTHTQATSKENVRFLRLPRFPEHYRLAVWSWLSEQPCKRYQVVVKRLIDCDFWSRHRDKYATLNPIETFFNPTVKKSRENSLCTSPKPPNTPPDTLNPQNFTLIVEISYLEYLS